MRPAKYRGASGAVLAADRLETLPTTDFGPANHEQPPDASDRRQRRSEARVVLLGLTPGWTQMEEAFRAARQGFSAGLEGKDLFRES